MNILFLLGKFPSIGGVETVTAILANEFSARGHAVHVVSFEQVTEKPSPALDERVTLHRLSYPVSSRANRNALRDILATCRIDVIINQWCLPFHVTRLCRKAMRGLPCRLLAVHHNAPDCNARLEGLRMRMARTGNPVNRAFLRLLLKGCAMATGASLRYVYAHSNRYILLSDSFHQAFRNITGLKDTGKLLTIPNPITVENPEFRYDPALKKKEVLFVGRLEPNQKRVSRVLETWALLEPCFPDWTLRLVGDGPEKRSLQEFCEEHRLKHVSFEGFQNPAPYYEQASLLFLTSEYEGFGLVIVEGMSFGVSPIVYGSFSAAYDLVDHGKDGCILPAAGGFQAHRMAEMAAGLMREPAALRAMARNAIAKSRKFTREHIIPQWEKAFLPDGLELIEVGTHHIGFHRKLGGRGEKNDLDCSVVLADLLGDGDAVFSRHDDIQKQDIIPHALFDLGQQIQRTAERCALDLDAALSAVFFQQGRQLIQNSLVVVAECDLDHSGFHILCSC